ncbi:MAG: hypothetical protein ACI4WM_07890 [Erysipelotrichaceae bacterium]
MQISDYFIKGDIKGAIEYMREHEEYKDILPAYISLFEKNEYIDYEVPELLNNILKLYQIYYHDIFYCDVKESEAADKLINSLTKLLNVDNKDDEYLSAYLKKLFKDNGYHAQFGKTQGYYGPYIWKETVETVYNVELPGGEAEYKVNILKGFIFRSWMDYLTFERFGTGGWTAEDGTISCIEKAYDFNSEKFTVSLLKHEAQHAQDMKHFKGIKSEELEYRAKLVELCYASDINLLQKFISEADENKLNDSHALASFKIKKGFENTDQSDIMSIQNRALKLFNKDTEEMKKKYN